jgi:hypothetical protein
MPPRFQPALPPVVNARVRRIPAAWLRHLRDRAVIAVRQRSASARPLPDFLVIGAQRAGTSTFYDLLAGHPDVAPSIRKEIHFFDRNFRKGPAWYRAHFPRRAPVRAGGPAVRTSTGEATPYYLFDPACPTRVASLLPDVRLIVLLRDPVDRAYSHWARERRLGREPLDFEAAIAEEERRLDRERRTNGTAGAYAGPHHRHHSYLARGHYAEQLERWLARFPRDRFLVLRSEDLYGQPREALRAAERFLGLRTWEPPEVRHLQRGRYETMPDALREPLARSFAPCNRRLEELLGMSFEWSR